MSEININLKATQTTTPLASEAKVEEKFKADAPSFSDVLEEKKTKEEAKEAKEEKRHQILQEEDNKEEEARKEAERLQKEVSGVFSDEELSPMQKFIYQLVYQNPSTMGLDQKALLGKGSGQEALKLGEVGLKELQKMLAERGIKLSQLNAKQLMILSTKQSKVEVTYFLDNLMKELQAQKEQESGKLNELARVKKTKKKAQTAGAILTGQTSLPLEQFFQTAKLATFKSNTEMERRILSQVLSEMNITQVQNRSEVAIRLNPEYLGEVKLNMTVEGGKVSVNFRTTSRQTRDVLEKNIGELKKAFQDSGLAVGELKVILEEA